MQVYTYHKDGLTAVVVAYNRGHACKELAKQLEKLGRTLDKKDPVTPLDLSDDNKGQVIVFK